MASCIRKPTSNHCRVLRKESNHSMTKMNNPQQKKKQQVPQQKEKQPQKPLLLPRHMRWGQAMLDLQQLPWQLRQGQIDRWEKQHHTEMEEQMHKGEPDYEFPNWTNNMDH